MTLKQLQVKKVRTERSSEELWGTEKIMSRFVFVGLRGGEQFEVKRKIRNNCQHWEENGDLKTKYTLLHDRQAQWCCSSDRVLCSMRPWRLSAMFPRWGHAAIEEIEAWVCWDAAPYLPGQGQVSSMSELFLLRSLPRTVASHQDLLLWNSLA